MRGRLRPSRPQARLGELFQYAISTPVTVGRGQSAMVPIASARLEARKDLLYNGPKCPRIPSPPCAPQRNRPDPGARPGDRARARRVRRRGVAAFHRSGSELVAPYAVELGAKVREETRQPRQGLRIKDLPQLRGVGIRWWEYQVNNRPPGPSPSDREPAPASTTYSVRQPGANRRASALRGKRPARGKRAAGEGRRLMSPGDSPPVGADAAGLTQAWPAEQSQPHPDLPR